MNPAPPQFLSSLATIAIAVGAWVISGIIAGMISRAILGVKLKHMDEKIEKAHAKADLASEKVQQITETFRQAIEAQTSALKALVFRVPDGRPIYQMREDCLDAQRICGERRACENADIKSALSTNTTQLGEIKEFMGRVAERMDMDATRKAGGNHV